MDIDPVDTDPADIDLVDILVVVLDGLHWVDMVEVVVVDTTWGKILLVQFDPGVNFADYIVAD